MLQVEHLNKTFDRFDKKTGKKSKVGIFDISFEALEGKIFGLIGANGAGKTTTMRILASLTNQHSGKVLLDGKPYNKIPNIKMLISFVSGETQIYDRLTPYEIISLFGDFAGFGKKELDERINMLAEKLDMKEFLYDTCGSFSTGMKQKVSIARALVTDPKVLIFDEITNGLDIFAAKAVKEQIKELRNEGKIILFSTHIMPDADELCDSIAILHKGEMLEYGNVSDLKKKYKKEKIEDIFFTLVKPSIDEESKS